MNFKFISNKASEILLEKQFSDLPIDPFKFKNDNIKITSYKNYAIKTGVKESDLTQNGELLDAYTVKSSKRGIYIILYNDRKYEPRKRFSIFHELGHIFLNHKEQNENNEIEADFFAAQLILPNVLVKEILKRGYCINQQAIVSIFNVSNKVAEKRISFLENYPDITNDYDDIVLLIFQNYLNSTFPNKNIYEDEEELERMRNEWREDY